MDLRSCLCQCCQAIAYAEAGSVSDRFGLRVWNGNPIYRHFRLSLIKPNQDLLQKVVIKLRERLNGFEAEVLVGLDSSLRHAATP